MIFFGDWHIFKFHLIKFFSNGLCKNETCLNLVITAWWRVFCRYNKIQKPCYLSYFLCYKTKNKSSIVLALKSSIKCYLLHGVHGKPRNVFFVFKNKIQSFFKCFTKVFITFLHPSFAFTSVTYKITIGIKVHFVFCF